MARMGISDRHADTLYEIQYTVISKTSQDGFRVVSSKTLDPPG